MQQLAVSASGLVKRFGDRRAVDGVGIAVPKGLIYGVLGPNGAGKTKASGHCSAAAIRATGATRSATCPRSAGSTPT